MTESFLGGDLPTPREISLKFFTDAPGESIKKDNLHTVFARFVEHDLYHTKLFDGKSFLLLTSFTLTQFKDKNKKQQLYSYIAYYAIITNRKALHAVLQRIFFQICF